MNAPLLKTFKPVRKVFKAAGKIRDVTLHEQQATAAGIPWEPLAEEQQPEKALHKLVSKGEKQLLKMKAVQQTLQQQLHALSTAEVNTFYEKQVWGI